MNLIGISINHRTADINLRETLHLSKDEITELIARLKHAYLSYGFILSTCNRTEIFGFTKDGGIDFQKLLDELLSYKKVGGLNSEHFDKFFSCAAVRHIFKVASGVDSQIIGDGQILGQAKESFQLSDDLNFSDSITRRIFDTAIKVGKRSIKETSIGEGAVTVSFAAVQVVEKIFSSLERKTALVIGAGETGELAATHLRDKGLEKLVISNRTLSRAEELAHKLKTEVLFFEDTADNLHQFDIIFSATSASNFIIRKEDIIKMMKRRKGLPVCIMDLALPRDIDPAVKELDNVFYNDIDSLNIIVNQNLLKRKAEVPKVESIIIEEMVNFFSWYNTLDVVPTIKAVREFFEFIGNDELEKIKNKVTQDDYSKIEDMTRRLLGRLLHNPTIKLKEIAETGKNPQNVAVNSYLLRNLFNLNGKQNNSREE